MKKKRNSDMKMYVGILVLFMSVFYLFLAAKLDIIFEMTKFNSIKISI